MNFLGIDIGTSGCKAVGFDERSALSDEILCV